MVLIMAHVPMAELKNIGQATVTGDDLTTHADNVIPAIMNEFVFVNGQYQPEKMIDSGKWQRVRMIYSSLKSSLRLQMLENSANCEWQLLAKDGIYVSEAPRSIGDTVYMGPGNRVDMVMRCAQGGSMTLGSVNVDNDDFAQTEIITFSVMTSASAADGDLPRFHPYRPDYLADLYNSAASNVATNYVNFQGVAGSCTINGLAWDGGVTPVGHVETGSIQQWQVSGNDRHPFHLHVNSYQLGSLTGSTNGFHEEGDWHDVLLRPGNLGVGHYYFSVDTFVTKSVIHCHFLTHEDLGCMGYFDHTNDQTPVTTGLTGQAMTCSGASTGTDVYTASCNRVTTNDTPSMTPTMNTGASMTPTMNTGASMTPTMHTGASMTPTMHMNDYSDFVPQVVEFNNLTSITARRNKEEWLTESAGVCKDRKVKRFNVLSIKSVIQAPHFEMLNMVLDVQHRKQTIMRERAFLKLSIVDIDGNQAFNHEQNLFEETETLTHFIPAVNTTDNSVNENMKIGLQVNLTDANVPLSDMSDFFATVIEVGIRDGDVATAPKVYDCVRINSTGMKMDMP
jgi:hypothetical protein